MSVIQGGPLSRGQLYFPDITVEQTFKVILPTLTKGVALSSHPLYNSVVKARKIMSLCLINFP